MPAAKLISRIGVDRSKFYDWRRRRSQANGHNDALPRESWLTDQEAEAVVKFHQENSSEGYRRLSYMMIDADVAERIGDSS